MKINFWSVGKVNDGYVKNGIILFTQRISNYFKVEWKLISPPKNAGSLPPEDLKKAEGTNILNHLQKDDFVVLLDEKGKQFTSGQLAKFSAIEPTLGG